MRLRSGKSAFWAAIVSSELSAFGASPDEYLSAVGAVRFRRLFSWRDSSVARHALGHNDIYSLAHSNTSRKTGYNNALLYMLSFNASRMP